MTDGMRWTPVVMRVHLVRRMLLLLLTALILVQTLGVLHRVAHAHSPHATTTYVDTTPNTLPGDLSPGLLKRLWGEHSSWVECQLFDQTCPDLLHATPVMDSVLPASPVWAQVVLQERFALFERFYAARGPPVVH